MARCIKYTKITHYLRTFSEFTNTLLDPAASLHQYDKMNKEPESAQDNKAMLDNARPVQYSHAAYLAGLQLDHDITLEKASEEDYSLHEAMKFTRDLFKRRIGSSDPLDEIADELIATKDALNKYITERKCWWSISFSNKAKEYVENQATLASELSKSLGETNAVRKAWFDGLRANGQICQMTDLYNIEQQIIHDLDEREKEISQDKDMTWEKRTAATAAIRMSLQQSESYRQTYNELNILTPEYTHGAPVSKIERQRHYQEVFEIVEEAVSPSSWKAIFDSKIFKPAAKIVLETISRIISNEQKQDLIHNVQDYFFKSIRFKELEEYIRETSADRDSLVLYRQPHEEIDKLTPEYGHETPADRIKRLQYYLKLYDWVEEAGRPWTDLFVESELFKAAASAIVTGGIAYIIGVEPKQDLIHSVQKYFMKRIDFKEASQKVYKEYSLEDPAWRAHLQAIPDPAKNFEAYLEVMKQPVGKFSNTSNTRGMPLERITEVA